MYILCRSSNFNLLAVDVFLVMMYVMYLMYISKGSLQKCFIVPEMNIAHFLLGHPPLPLKGTQLAMLDDENCMHVYVVMYICIVSVDL